MGWELKWMEWADGWWSSPVLDHVLPWLTYLGSHFAFILFIILSWIITKQRKVLRRLLLLYGIQSFVIYGLKFLVQRQRPLFFLEVASKLSKGPGEILDPSFPSGHAAFSFMMATLLALWFPRYRFIFFIVAGFVGWTRIYLGLHYPTDVIAGSLLGYGITKLFLHWVAGLNIKTHH
jgi:undecaprenyl-diphosphatase